MAEAMWPDAGKTRPACRAEYDEWGIFAGQTRDDPNEAEENAGECETIYPARKEKTAQKEKFSNLKKPLFRSLKAS